MTQEERIERIDLIKKRADFGRNMSLSEFVRLQQLNDKFNGKDKTK